MKEMKDSESSRFSLKYIENSQKGNLALKYHRYVSDIVRIITKASEVFDDFERKMNATANITAAELGKKVTKAKMKKLGKRSEKGEFDSIPLLISTSMEAMDKVRMRAASLEVPNEAIKDSHRDIIKTISYGVDYFHYAQEFCKSGKDPLNELANDSANCFRWRMREALSYAKELGALINEQDR